MSKLLITFFCLSFIFSLPSQVYGAKIKIVIKNITLTPSLSTKDKIETTSTEASVPETPEVVSVHHSKLRKCSSDFLIDLNRIYGGEDARQNEFPHQASLQIRFLDSHICGGSLITNRWVMSAAHCFSRGSYPYTWQIKLGEHHLFKDDPAHERTFRVEKVIIHEKYNRTNQVYDIALLKLTDPVDLGGTEKHLKTVCLADKNTPIRKDYKCMATGWGRGDKGTVRTAILQKLPQPVHNSTRCAKIWKKSTWPITKDHICIGDLKGGRGVCNGDSGGPVQCQLRNGDWVQFGIASWTISDCISKGYAAVFTKVSSYLDWIEHQIKNN